MAGPGYRGYNAGMRNALKACGAILAVIALCAPMMFLPAEDTQPSAFGYAGVTITVPPTVVVPTTIPGLETTTTTTAPPVQPPVTNPAPSNTTTTTAGPVDVTIAAVGNVLTPPGLLKSIWNESNGSYDFDPVLAPVAPYLEDADYTLAALGPRLAGPDIGYSSPDVPNAPRELAFALRKAGVDLVGTANAHSLDLGWEGITGTLDRLDAAGLAHMGTARSSTERSTPVVVDIKGIRIGFLDYTMSVDTSLPAEEQKDFAVNLLDVDTVQQDAGTARAWGADIVVAMLDYGDDYEQQPSAERISLSEKILDQAGVDVIIGCHPHVIQTIGHWVPLTSSRSNDKYIAYSVGDFLSIPQTVEVGGDSVSTSGMVVYLHVRKSGLHAYLTGVSYLPLFTQVGSAATGTATVPSGQGSDATTKTSGPVTSAAPGDEDRTVYRVLPVLPGMDPATDIPLMAEDRAKMSEIWEYARSWLYRPDERITPLSRGELGS